MVLREKLQVVSEVEFNRLVSILVFLGIIGLNVGYNDYVSVTFIFSIFFLFYGFYCRHFEIRIAWINGLKLGLAISVFPVVYFFFTTNDLHTALSHLRELFFVAMIALYVYKSDRHDSSFYFGYRYATYIVATFVSLQSLQIFLGKEILTIPQEWLMLDYGNSLQTALFHGYDYLRPVAFYSEPSVVAAVMIPSLYLAIKMGRYKEALYFSFAIFLSRSMFGMLAVLFVYAHRFGFGRLFPLMFPIVLSGAYLIYSSDRFGYILSGEDESFVWRFVYPINFLYERVVEEDWMPLGVADTYAYQEYYFSGASVTDTWPLYILVKLGFVGVFWIPYVFSMIPVGFRFYFFYLSLISGAPLYHDKVFLFLVVFVSTRYVNSARKHL